MLKVLSEKQTLSKIPRSQRKKPTHSAITKQSGKVRGAEKEPWCLYKKHMKVLVPIKLFMVRFKKGLVL